jgi:outer membrane protein assembly factor BamB
LRQPLVRLLGVVPAALLLSGLLIVAVAPVAPVAAASGDWPQSQNSPARNGFNSQETVISASNVHSLELDWTADRHSFSYPLLVVADGVVYVGGGTGWETVQYSPGVANGVVYVSGGQDSQGRPDVQAYAVGCASGGGTCTPLWTAAAGRPGDGLGSPTVANGVVYVGSNEGATGKLYAFAVGCNSGGGTCTPLWTGATYDRADGSPAVAGGVVYISSGGLLYAFAVGCASGGRTCTPLWKGATHGSISSPAVANGVVYVGSTEGKVYAFAVGCASGGRTCAPLWTSVPLIDRIGSPSVANGVVYVTSPWGNQKLYAFAVGCASGGGTCTPLWTAAGGATPAVANGVVYTGNADKLYAYAVGCASGGGTCSPLWTGSADNSKGPASVAVANGAVYVEAGDGTFYAFGLPGATYHALTPARVLDSRTKRGLSLFHSQVKQTLTVATAASGVPSSAVAVTGNLTIVGQTHAGYVTVAPSLTSGVQPPTSTINFPVGDVRANGMTVPLASGGKLDLMYWSASKADTVNVIFDVTGYFAIDATGATYHALTPARVLDSRSHLGASLFHSQVKQTLSVATPASGVPSNAVAVTGNVTVVGQTHGGYVTVAPHLTSGVQPPTSTINFPVGDVRANGMTVPLASGGKLDLMYWSASKADTTNVIFDVTGYFS